LSILWTECNNRLFNNAITPIPRLLDKVKYLSLGWLKAKKSPLCLAQIGGGRALFNVWASTNGCYFLLNWLTLCIFRSFIDTSCAIETSCCVKKRDITLSATRALKCENRVRFNSKPIHLLSLSLSLSPLYSNP